jgi:Ca2+-binding RTX toxin-like protein
VNDAPLFSTPPVTSLALGAPRSRANLDSVFQAVGPPGAVTVRFERLEKGDAVQTGLYRVDDVYGTVNGIAAGDDGYVAAAAARARAIVPGASLTLEGGALYAFYAVLGGHDRDDKNGHGYGHGDDHDHHDGDPQLVFSIAEANEDGRDRMEASIDASGRLTIEWNESGNKRDDDDDCKDERDDGTVLRATGFALPAQTTSYRYDADAIDVDGDTLTYTLLQAPSGAAIDAATGVVTWTPSAAGLYGFVIRVEDRKGGTAEQAYTLNVTRQERLLDVRGTDCNDQIEVSEDEDGIVRVTINGATRFYSGLTGIRVDALGGNDQVRLKGLTASTLVEGGAGNDKIDGSSVIVARLELRGDAGNDDLRGGARADYLVGGDGNDVLRGGAGGDWIFGGLGKDVLFGDDGNDVLVGGEGDDVVKGGYGDDILVSGPGCDNLDGGPGADRTVLNAAFIAGTVPGLPAQPSSMRDWRWDLAARAGGAGKDKDCRIDWSCKGNWGGLDDSWRRKAHGAEFVEVCASKEPQRPGGATKRADRRDD